MPRAFLLKRQSEKNNMFLSERCKIEVSDKNGLLTEDAVKKKKREKLSRMINDIKMAIQREEDGKPRKRIKYDYVNGGKSFQEEQRSNSFSIDRILKTNKLKIISKFESKNTAFKKPTRNNNPMINQAKYREIFDITTSPRRDNFATRCKDTSCSPIIKSEYWHEAESSFRTSPRSENSCCSPEMSYRSSESSSTESKSSGSNTVNRNKKEINKIITHESAFSSYSDDNNNKYCDCIHCNVNKEFLRRSEYANVKSPRVFMNMSESVDYIETPRSRILSNESKQRANEYTDIQIENREVKRKQQIYKSADELLNVPTGTTRSRAMANLLERRRVAELNSAFENLRDMVPLYGNEDRSLSKIKTLRYAMNYMNHLSSLLKEQVKDTNTCLTELSRRDSSVEKFRENIIKRKLIT